MTYLPPGDDTGNVLEIKRLDAGWLGKIFGTGDTSSNNIAGICIIICLLFGGIMCIYYANSNSIDPYEIWTYLTPIITGSLGYIFGRQSIK